MGCVSPITVKTKVGNVSVACKQCLNCRIHRQSSLVAAALLEDAVSFSGSFVTLTYANAPDRGDYRDISLFLKRLAEREFRLTGQRTTRYLSVGEYGAKSGRFHYHALLWNTPQKLLDSLIELWPHGFVCTGTVTPNSVRYTARYTLKFQAKGLEACAAWSKNPPLGSAGVRSIAAYMRDDPKGRYHCQMAPSTIQLQGRSYPLKPVLQREFMRELTRNNSFELPVSAAAAHLDHQLKLVVGDPVAAQRARQLERNTFWESARLVKEAI